MRALDVPGVAYVIAQVAVRRPAHAAARTGAAQEPRAHEKRPSRHFQGLITWETLHGVARGESAGVRGVSSPYLSPTSYAVGLGRERARSQKHAAERTWSGVLHVCE